jgi:exodeoxyribonuclease V alpha subunit
MHKAGPRPKSGGPALGNSRGAPIPSDSESCFEQLRLEARVAANPLGALHHALTLFFGLGAGPGWLGEEGLLLHHDKNPGLVALALEATQGGVEGLVRTDLDLDQGCCYGQIYDGCGRANPCRTACPEGPDILVENSRIVQSAGSSSRHGNDGGGHEHQTLSGQVISIVFRAEDSGFAVAVLEVTDGDPPTDGADSPFTADSPSTTEPDASPTASLPDTTAVAGDLGEINEGDYLKLHGYWKKHPRFGRQFQASWSEQTTPNTVDGLRKYLASDSFPGIGPDMARRLVEHFGDDALDAMDAGAAKLQEVEGIGPVRAATLAEAFAVGRARHRVMAELRGLGLNGGQANKLYERWQAAAIERVRADPYALIGELRGIGFETAERMAKQLDIPKDSVVRGKGVVQHLLKQGMRDGHTCLPEATIDQQLGSLGLSEENATAALVELIQNRKLICAGEVNPTEQDGASAQRWYVHPQADHAEAQIATTVRRLTSGTVEAAANPDLVMNAIRRAEHQPDASQLQAVEMALREGFSVMTGGPGTGKTTTLRLILDILEAAGIGPIKLASPTGRAAKRLHEATGRQASTVHRLLGWDPIQAAWKHDDENPIDAEYLIVDEVSMLDVFVASALMRAIPENCRLLLVGDADQLPSVSAGAVLRDLLRCRTVAQTRLQLVHRQGRGSGIVDAAHSILHGQAPTTSTSPAGDFFATFPDNADTAADLVERIVCERIPEKYGLNPRTDILVLSPMYRGPLGVDALNERLARRLNPDGEGAEWSRGLRIGDRAMIVRNDYEREVFNGDTGVVTHISNDELFLEVDGTVHSYGREEMTDLIPAYCVTVHRSQGSEAQAVVIALAGSHYMMLRRNLLYTAVTRGKKLVTVVTEPHAFRRAVANAEESQRWTRLQQRIEVE